MKTTKLKTLHTTRPWKIDPSPRHAFDIKAGKLTVCSIPANRMLLPKGVPYEEVKANVRLVAGAPRLFAALRVAENAIRGQLTHETPGSGEYQDLEWALGVVRSALADAA